MHQDFETDPALVYLNAANLSLCPTNVVQALHRYRLEFERNPTQGLARAWGQLWEVQRRLAAFLGASPEGMFLRPNVTAVLNTFLLGVPLPRGSEILVTEHEYGAILNICRLRAQRDGLKLRVLKLPGNPTQFQGLTREKLAREVISQLGPDTRLFLLSHVMSGTGLVMPLEEIAAATRAKNILLVVDGAYAPGAMPVDLSETSNIDFYGCSLYKWMLGPKGTAFGWVSKVRQPLLAPTHAGWTTFSGDSPVTGFGAEGTFATSFLMSGCHDFAPFHAIADTLDFWDRHGANEIRARMEGLRKLLVDKMENRLGWRRLEAADSSLRGPMLSYLLPPALQPKGGELARELLERHALQLNSACLQDKWYLVFSPHVHNTEEDISRAVERLALLFEMAS